VGFVKAQVGFVKGKVCFMIKRMGFGQVCFVYVPEAHFQQNSAAS